LFRGRDIAVRTRARLLQASLPAVIYFMTERSAASRRSWGQPTSALSGTADSV